MKYDEMKWYWSEENDDNESEEVLGSRELKWLAFLAEHRELADPVIWFLRD